MTSIFRTEKFRIHLQRGKLLTVTHGSGKSPINVTPFYNKKNINATVKNIHYCDSSIKTICLFSGIIQVRIYKL